MIEKSSPNPFSLGRVTLGIRQPPFHPKKLDAPKQQDERQHNADPNRNISKKDSEQRAQTTNNNKSC
jgi:hypothetical protein